ncbi:beta-glucoside-specific PTS transporter subunit IIABC [Propionispira raffinosivorans]|uniref:beta-glucoside-specific PTS transporter subunit IIABC n=1 Tax=Propionispira raffinosivorans TaxID=86959 RepID=UPI000373195B|nr:beta-glucoside-specific PTS transporter subunit IIABC [Propionispira raffinosivorans]
MKQENISNLIIENVGGIENVVNLYHCMTRLRFILKDQKKFNAEALKNIPGVINIVQSGAESQIIIGAEVDTFYNDLLKQGLENFSDCSSNQEKQKFNIREIFQKGLTALAGIMAPILPILIAGGMVKVVLALLVLSGMSRDSQNYKILYFISDATFYFLPFFIANSFATRIKANNYMAMVIAGILLHPNFMSMVSEGKAVSFFDLPVRLVSYSATVIPIIFAVWFMSYVEKVVEKYTPKLIKTMFRPLLTLLITAPVVLIVIGPLGGYLGEGLYYVIQILNENVPWAVPMLMGTFSPLLVMAGMHLSITPFAILSVSRFGYETLMGPGMLGSNIAQGGASLAIAFKEKRIEKREVAISAGITALSGITEPALYGVTVKYKRALLCVMVSGGIAGLYAGITGVVRYAIASASFLSLPVFIGDNPNNIINAIITAMIALVLSFVLTYVFVPVESVAEETKKEVENDKEEVKNVVAGTLIPLQDVKDEAFSSGTLGGGAAIIPQEGAIHSPVDGVLSMVYPTGHAIGITSKSGKEILIHIGIDTVKLDGEGFKSHIKTGMEVKKGDLLIEVDLNLLKEKGYDTTVIIVILNRVMDNLIITKKDRLTIQDTLLEIID